MATVAEPTRFTPADLLRLPQGKHCELVDGQLVEQDMSLQASEVAANVIGILREFVRAHRLGGVYSSDVGYRCFAEAPDKVRKPDVSFISTLRLTPDLMEGHVPIPPDLAVEVVSPNDYFREVQDKVGEYLRAGVRLVWVLEPSSRTILVYRADGSGETLGENGRLSGDTVLPGFSRPALDFFESAVKATT